MKKLNIFFLVIFTFIANMSVFTQEITFVPRDTLIQGNIGDEMIFYIDVTNISSVEQTFFMVRTINDLPADWTSSMCFDASDLSSGITCTNCKLVII